MEDCALAGLSGTCTPSGAQSSKHPLGAWKMEGDWPDPVQYLTYWKNLLDFSPVLTELTYDHGNGYRVPALRARTRRVKAAERQVAARAAVARRLLDVL